jgi:hypothetical protein
MLRRALKTLNFEMFNLQSHNHVNPSSCYCFRSLLARHCRWIDAPIWF